MRIDLCDAADSYVRPYLITSLPTLDESPFSSAEPSGLTIPLSSDSNSSSVTELYPNDWSAETKQAIHILPAASPIVLTLLASVVVHATIIIILEIS